MMSSVSTVGFGEAASAFAQSWVASGLAVHAYDRKTDKPETRVAKQADFERVGVHGCGTAADAVASADLVACLVTADQATAAAREAAMTIAPGTLWLDMNSVAPDTKRTAARVIEAVGGRYVDVAVLSPVLPKRLTAPLMVSGPHSTEATRRLADLGFTDITVVDGGVGAAAAVKMIRSIMVKGIEALSAELAIAADRAGVTEAVVASLDASWPGADWGHRLDYNLDRMMVHGLRRAAEMEESVATLDSLGVGSTMTRGTVALQQSLGALGIDPPDGLTAKLAALAPVQKEAAA